MKIRKSGFVLRNSKIQNILKFILLFSPLLITFAFFVYQLYGKEQTQGLLSGSPIYAIIPFIIVVVILLAFYKYNRSIKNVLHALLWTSPLLLSYTFWGYQAMLGFANFSSSWDVTLGIVLLIFFSLLVSYIIMGFFLILYLLGLYSKRNNKG